MSDVSAPSRPLALVMGLPLVDGVFATLVVAGTLQSVVGVVQVGLLVFGGAATTALLLASGADRRQDVKRVLAVGVPLGTLAALEAAVAPALVTLLDTETFQPFAGLVLVAVAARVASAHVTRYLPGPGLVVVAGVLLSFDPGPVTLDPNLDAAGRALLAAGVGVAFALGVVFTRVGLRRLLDAERFRFGSAVALGTMGASVAGLVPASSPLPLATLAIAALLSLDPESDADAEGEADASGEDPSTP